MSRQPTTFYNDPAYNYQAYWQKRAYENQADKIALGKLLQLIPRKKKLIDIGAGFGRLTSVYTSKAAQCVLVDSSQRMLEEAKKEIKSKNVRFIKSSAGNLPFKDSAFDIAVMVRTLHHLPDPEKAIKEVTRILKSKGYFILEFANKIHLKSVLRAILGRKMNYLLSHRPEDIATHRQVPFFNYHPSHIKSLLLTNGFKVIKTLSASNFRQPFLKKIIPLSILLFLETHFSPLISRLSPSFGPSIFILAQKE